MTTKELKRLHVINKVLEKQISQVTASEVLNLSTRQIRRVVKRVKSEGEQGIIHKARECRSNRALPNKIKQKVLMLYEKKYYGFGPTLFSEKLEELHEIKISDETLRNWLLANGSWKKKRKVKGHHSWRQRKESFGEMVLLDGSHHDWLEGRGDELVLMGYIDDATGTCYGRFYDYEGTMPAFDSFKGYIEKCGIPMRLYMDKHTTYRSNKKPTIEEELKGVKAQSQFERACEELGVEVIHANSPQAKGRIERLFGTFQDRLIKEMRLAGVRDKESANKFLEQYLPKFIEKFSVEPISDVNLHQEVPSHINLDSILAIKKERHLRSDNTVSFNNKLFLLEDKIPAKKVVVEQRTDGSIHISYNNKYLKYKEVEARPKKISAKPKTEKVKKPYIPPADHPWKKFRIKPASSYKNKVIKKEVPCLSTVTK